MSNSENVLETGEPVPDFELKDYKGQNVALSDLDNYDGVLVIFMCNHCPYVQAEVPEIKKLNDKFSSIAIVGINPNSETHPMDSEEKMPEFIEEKDLESAHFYYLSDPDQEVAEKFGAECTPDPFLLDMRHRLFYHSKLNDKAGPDDEVEKRYMADAIEKMLKRKEPPEEREDPVGCSIKWKE